jgi:hypothetical protein
MSGTDRAEERSIPTSLPYGHLSSLRRENSISISLHDMERWLKAREEDRKNMERCRVPTERVNMEYVRN